MRLRGAVLAACITANMLDEQLARFYSVRELYDQNINLEDLLDPIDVETVIRGLAGHRGGHHGAPRIRVLANDQRFLLEKQIVPT